MEEEVKEQAVQAPALKIGPDGQPLIGPSDMKKMALKKVKKAYDNHNLKFKDYVYWTKFIEKYWVEVEAEEVEEPNPILTEMTTKEKPLDMIDAFGK